MISPSFHGIVLAGALASATIAASAGTSVAGTSYDGSWSVLITTDSGACERAYRYGVAISDGYVLYEGGGPVNLEGWVARKGRSGSASWPANNGPTPGSSVPDHGRILARPRVDRRLRRQMGSGTARIAHHPEKHVLDRDRGWIPVFGKDHAQNKELERDDDSKKRIRSRQACFGRSSARDQTATVGENLGPREDAHRFAQAG